MNKLLDKYLCKKYPKIFVERKQSVAESCMGRGFECGDGWFHLLEELCYKIQDRINYRQRGIKEGWALGSEWKPIPQFVALQVKEKFGALRIYYKGGDDTIGAWVDFVESLSAWVCENCGRHDQEVGRVSEGWIQGLCPTCAFEFGKTISQRKDLVQLWKKVIKSRSNPKRSWKAVDELTREDLGLKPKKKKEKK